MSALDNLRNKTFHPEKMNALDWFIWNNRNAYQADEAVQEIAALRSEIANYETARQEDARRLEQVIAERDAMRQMIRESKELLNVASLQLFEANYSTLPGRIDAFTDKLAAALKDGKA